jgi:hypothetical protein
MWAIGLVWFSLAVAVGMPVVTSSAPQFLMLVSAFFVLCGIMSLMWIPKLKVTGPYIFQDHLAINHWRMKVHNEGPATAVNVRMRLCDIDTRPKYPLWVADYRYPVRLVGTAGNAQFSCRINQNDDAAFEIVSGWRNNGDFYTGGLDTKAKDNPIRIENNERWVLKYDIISDNATSINFSVEMFIDPTSRTLMAKRKN